MKLKTPKAPSQAEEILKNFFVKHPLIEFTVVHKRKSGRIGYFIGELTCNDAIFRVTINSKTGDSSKEISTGTIERIKEVSHRWCKPFDPFSNSGM